MTRLSFIKQKMTSPTVLVLILFIGLSRTLVLADDDFDALTTTTEFGEFNNL